MIDLGRLRVEGAVFHQIPRKKPLPGTPAPKNGPEVTLSTVESVLDDQLEAFLQSRINESMSGSAQPIVPDEERSQLVPDAVRESLDGGNSDIADRFDAAAHHLLETQHHTSPEGLFAVVRGHAGQTPILALVKVERERGLSFEVVDDRDGVRVEVVFEDGLVLTGKTKVFKAAIFYVSHTDASGTHIAGYVTDDQSGSSMYDGPSSLYWIHKFLGCRYSRDADVQTRAFAKAIERTIRTDIKSAAQQSTALSALRAELGSNRKSIDPKKFVADFIPSEVQDSALQRLRDAGASSTSFPKSADVSAASPTTKTVLFRSGVKVVFPEGTEPELSTEGEEGDEVDVLTIRGEVKHVS